MAFPSTRELGRWGFVALTGAIGCATGTQGDDLIAGLDQGGSSATAGSSSNETGGTDSGVAGSGGTESAPFGGFANAGSFGTAGSFGSGGTSGGTANAGGSSGSGGMASGGKAGSGGSGGSMAGTGGKAGAGGSAGSGGKAGGTCGSTKLTVSAATGTEERADLGPEFAIDGDMGTRWGSEHSEPQTLDLDLGEAVTVKRVLINWEVAYASNFQLQLASAAAGPFTTIYTEAAGDGGTDDITSLTVSDGRYLRMNGITRGTEFGFSIYEIVVYGDKDETCQ